MGIFNKNNKDNNNIKWYDKIINDNKDNIKKYFLVSNDNWLILLTNDNKICFYSSDNERIIDIVDIIECNFIINTTNKINHNFLNILYLSFKEVQEINSIRVELITLDKVHKFTIYHFLKEQDIDNLKIISAYLNKKIKNNEF